MRKFYVGQKVRITGDASDYTDHLHGLIGTIKNVSHNDCLVEVDEDDGVVLDWMIWNYNMTPVDVTDSEA